MTTIGNKNGIGQKEKKKNTVRRQNDNNLSMSSRVVLSLFLHIIQASHKRNDKISSLIFCFFLLLSIVQIQIFSFK